MASGMIQLLEHLKTRKILKTSTLADAFLTNDRLDFVTEECQSRAYEDIPLPTYSGQTISQPYTVAFMMELLQPKLGDEVLDVGFGSGWTTAILAKVVGEQGRILAVEIISDVFKFGKENLKKYNYPNIEFFRGSWVDLSPQKFDCILVSAAADASVPNKLATRLKIGGRLVIPVISIHGHSIRLLKKENEGRFMEENYPGFAFVPLV